MITLVSILAVAGFGIGFAIVLVVLFARWK
jgi:hypothetical protein